jgi:tRNA U34 5-methylaminomethyl-2-thiouridine-forming methyltransferase MnmC
MSFFMTGKTQHIGQLGVYRVVTTDDQTTTLFSEHFNEACHSTSGALAETIHNYIQALDIAQKAQIPDNTPLNILEVGLGLGVGLKATLDSLISLGPKWRRPLHYYALELDPLLVDIAKEHNPLLSGAFPDYNDLLPFEFGLQASKGLHRLTLLLGDARLRLPEFCRTHPELKFEAIYQDAFSPKQNPSLWTLEWFTLLRSLASPTAELSTYSASQSVRKTMLAAQWSVQSLVGFGRKRQATKALIDGQSDPELLKLLDHERVQILRD